MTILPYRRTFSKMALAAHRSSTPHPTVKHLVGPLRTGTRRLLRARSACLQGLSEKRVHELRRAARRSQPLLAVLKRAAPTAAEVRMAQRTVRRILKCTGPLRDAQVRLPVVAELVREGQLGEAAIRRAEREVRSIRRSVHAELVLMDVRPLQQVLKLSERGLTGPSVARAMDRVRVRWTERLQQRIDDLTAKDTTSLHRARIALKRYRYLMEAFPGAWNASAPTGASLSELQARLGRWHDAWVLERWCTKLKLITRNRSILRPADLRVEERTLRKLIRQLNFPPTS
jgi:CHAD domain-containing protein